MAFDEEYYLAANPDVAMAVRAGLCISGRHHYDLYGCAEGRAGSAGDVGAGASPSKAHRRVVIQALCGAGIEIGAFDSPCPVAPDATVTYCDVATVEDAKKRFPELVDLELQAPDVIIDIDRKGLSGFDDESADFVIFNHVIEHVANPLFCLAELLRVLRPAGHLVIAAPDKRYTLDRARAITPWSHLEAEYRSRVIEVDPVHFADIVALMRPDVIASGVDSIRAHMDLLKDRREHAHVWDSEAFRDFLRRAMSLFDVQCRTVFEATGDETRFEYFTILEKG